MILLITFNYMLFDSIKSSNSSHFLFLVGTSNPQLMSSPLDKGKTP